MEVFGAWNGEMEGEMEVSVPELYYSAKNCFCEYKKGIVCGKVAMHCIHHYNTAEFQIEKEYSKSSLP